METEGCANLADPKSEDIKSAGVRSAYGRSLRGTAYRALSWRRRRTNLVMWTRRSSCSRWKFLSGAHAIPVAFSSDDRRSPGDYCRNPLVGESEAIGMAKGMGRSHAGWPLILLLGQCFAAVGPFLLRRVCCALSIVSSSRVGS